VDLVIPWILFPALLLASCFGVGLLVERAAGYLVPAPLLFGLGFTGLVGVTQVLSRTGLGTVLAPAAVVVLAAAGFALSWSRVRALRPDRWTIALAVVVGLVFAAPALLTGERTFLGYQDLGDASIHFELTDRWLSDGPNVDGLERSTYSDSLNAYFVTAYPAGAHTVLGAAGALTGTDAAWLFQPYLVVLVVMAALGLFTLAQWVTTRRWLAALIAGLAIQAALVFSYAANQQALKELAAVLCIVTMAGLVASLVRAKPGWRAGLPAAVALGGGLGVFNLAVAPWAGPLMVAALIALVHRYWRTQRNGVLAEVAAFGALAVVLALPALTRLNSFVDVSNDALVGAEEYGNLTPGRPLEFVQALGTWPVPDFRLPLEPGSGFAYVLIGVFALAALFGLATAVRRRAWPVVLFGAVSLIGFLAVAGRASPWAYGKALMILSPAVVLMAGVCVAGWWEARRRTEASIVLALLLVGIVWTNAQTYHGTSAAPHDRMHELERIGDRFAGDGPLYYFESEEFAKYFLRDAAPTGATEAIRPNLVRAVLPFRFGYSSDADDWSATGLADHYELLVVRRGPTASRPPISYKRAFAGRYYDVWQRDRSAPEVLRSLPLGGRLDGAADVPCDQVEALAGMARDAGGRLAYVPRAAPVTFRVGRAGGPLHWVRDPGDRETWRPDGPGRLVGDIDVPHAGTYTIWFEASLGRRATLFIDDREVASLEDALNPRWSTTRVGIVDLEAGTRRIRLDVGGGSLDPRNGGRNRLIGPVFLTTESDPSSGAVRTIAPDEWRSLCGMHADWVQAVA
jgi:hypothetical protein